MMNIAAFLLATCFACIYAYDVTLMNILTSSIEEVEHKKLATANRNIPEVAGELGLNGLMYLVKKAGLVDTLSGKGPFTVFGPTDEAFHKLPRSLLILLAHDKKLLTKVLTYHVAAGNVTSSELSNDLLVKSVEGSDIRINIYGDDISDKKIITASGRVISKPDQFAENGVIHVVDAVLFPPAGTFVDVVSNVHSLSTLLTAVQKADAKIAEILSSPGNLTLFAPTNNAFAEIPKPCLDALLANKTALTRVLEYHVVPETYYSAGLTCGQKLTTAEGSDVSISKFFGLYVDCSKVIFPDVTVTNGVLHAINKVLIPGDLLVNMCPESQDVENNMEHFSEEFPFLF